MLEKLRMDCSRINYEFIPGATDFRGNYYTKYFYIKTVTNLEL